MDLPHALLHSEWAKAAAVLEREGESEREAGRRDIYGNDSKPIRWQRPKKINVWVGLEDDVWSWTD